MKHLKTFEFFETNTGQALDYTEGDIVICVNNKPHLNTEIGYLGLNQNSKYKVLKIYKIREDKMLGKPYMRVDVENLETGDVTRGWESTRFKLEVEFYGDKYNL